MNPCSNAADGGHKPTKMQSGAQESKGGKTNGKSNV